MTKTELPISLVIATLGGDVLKTTISHINQGECIPSEILVCIPELEAASAECVASFRNVNVIKTSCRGQVAQRAVGLRMSKFPYVMQLDDDVTLPRNTVKVLFESLLAMGTGNILAPTFRLKHTGDEVTRYPEGLRGLLRSFHATLVCGARFGRGRMGTISPAGIGFGVPMSSEGSRIVESEWLPGGLALSHKSDLITYNYYPFPGKAYSEDLIHSILWRQQGCRLWTSMEVSAMIDVTIESLAWKCVISRYRAHAYVARLCGGSVWYTRLWFVFYSLRNFPQLLAHNFFSQLYGLRFSTTNYRRNAPLE